MSHNLEVHHNDAMMSQITGILTVCITVCQEGNPPVTGWGQWRWALMLSLMCAWTIALANSRDDGDLRHHGAHYDAIVMTWALPMIQKIQHLLINKLSSKSLKMLVLTWISIRISHEICIAASLGTVLLYKTPCTLLYPYNHCLIHITCTYYP